MKRLKVVGYDGLVVSDSLLNIQGEDFSLRFPLPIFLPILGISLTEIEDKEKKELKKIGAIVGI